MFQYEKGVQTQLHLVMGISVLEKSRHMVLEVRLSLNATEDINWVVGVQSSVYQINIKLIGIQKPQSVKSNS